MSCMVRGIISTMSTDHNHCQCVTQRRELLHGCDRRRRHQPVTAGNRRGGSAALDRPRPRPVRDRARRTNLQPHHGRKRIRTDPDDGAALSARTRGSRVRRTVTSPATSPPDRRSCVSRRRCAGARCSTALPSTAQPHLDELTRRTGESTYLAVSDGRTGTYVATAESPRAIRHVGWIGQDVDPRRYCPRRGARRPRLGHLRTGAVEADITAMSRATARQRKARSRRVDRRPRASLRPPNNAAHTTGRSTSPSMRSHANCEPMERTVTS